MKNKSFKYLPLVTVLLIVPQLTFAAWWNPLSWRVFNFKKLPQKEIQQEQNSTTTVPLISTTTITTSTKTVKNYSEINKATELPKKQIKQLTPKVPEASKDEQKKTSTLYLPNGAIVETDVNGNITRTVKEAPSSTNVFNSLTQQIAELNKKLEEQKQIQQQSQNTLQQIQQNTAPKPQQPQPAIEVKKEIIIGENACDWSPFHGTKCPIEVSYKENGNSVPATITISIDDTKGRIVADHTNQSSYPEGNPISNRTDNRYNNTAFFIYFASDQNAEMYTFSYSYPEHQPIDTGLKITRTITATANGISKTRTFSVRYLPPTPQE